MKYELLRSMRAKLELSQQSFAAAAGVSSKTYERAEAGGPISLDTARSIASVYNVDYLTLIENGFSPFYITPVPNIGINFRPHPEVVDEANGYAFCGKYNGVAGTKCVVRKIKMIVKRNDHIAIQWSVGTDTDSIRSNHPDESYFGFITIGGKRHYVDGSGLLYKPIKFDAEENFVFSISSWCRAIGISRNEPETHSIFYWIENPEQIVEIEYSVGNTYYTEQHEFVFDSTEMISGKSSIKVL